jgi:hypothetical protein
MTKRNTKSESSTASTLRPKRASATHSHKSSAGAPGIAETVSVDQDAIARLAYSYWEARGFGDGSPEEDWFRAERELLSR